MSEKIYHSSKSVEWATPQDFFEKYNKQFQFTLDVCATKQNAKCLFYFDKEINGLIKSWGRNVCWMNPPYGRNETALWIRKAYMASLKGATVVCLVPARTDTKWFHIYVLGHAKIEWVKGRLKFGGSKNAAPFPSMVCIFTP